MSGKTITGVVDWLKQWFYTKEEIVDTGWTSFDYRELPKYSGGNHYYDYMIPDTSVIAREGTDESTYLTDYPNEPIRIRRVGKVVHIEGAMTSNLSVTIDSSTYCPLGLIINAEQNNQNAYTSVFSSLHIGTLSEDFRPSSPITVIQQGSGFNHFLLRITADGKVYWSRYGVSTVVNPSTSPWFNFNITYTIG